MTVLVISETEKARLRAAQDRARKNPVTLDMLRRFGLPAEHTGTVTLSDRWQHPELVRPESEHVNGYCVAISYEEQPVGLCLHLSMSTTEPYRIPRPEAIAMVLDRLDLPPPRWTLGPWNEYEGGSAVNILILVAPRHDWQPSSWWLEVLE
jgi:hypothetical protein